MAAGENQTGISSSTLGLAVGLGVGVPVVLTIVILIWVTLRHRRLARDEDERHKDIDIDGDVTMADIYGHRYPTAAGMHPSAAATRADLASLSDAGSVKYSLPRGRPEGEDSSTYMYAPYMTGTGTPMNEYSRSLHSLVGPSPAFPSQDRLRNVRSHTSLSSQWRSGLERSGEGPFGSNSNLSQSASKPSNLRHETGSASINSELPSESEWSPRHLRKSSFTPSRRNSRNSSILSANEEATVGSEFTTGDDSTRASPVHNRDRESSHRERRAGSSNGTPSRPSHQHGVINDVHDEGDEDRLDEPGAEYGEDVNSQSWSQSEVSRAKSRGHAAVLDLYDTYRNKSLRVPRQPNFAEESEHEIEPQGGTQSLDRSSQDLSQADREHQATELPAASLVAPRVLHTSQSSPESDRFTDSGESPEESQNTDYSRYGGESDGEYEDFSFDNSHSRDATLASKPLPVLPTQPEEAASENVQTEGPSQNQRQSQSQIPTAISTDSFVSAVDDGYTSAPARVSPAKYDTSYEYQSASDAYRNPEDTLQRQTQPPKSVYMAPQPSKQIQPQMQPQPKSQASPEMYQKYAQPSPDFRQSGRGQSPGPGPGSVPHGTLPSPSRFNIGQRARSNSRSHSPAPAHVPMVGVPSSPNLRAAVSMNSMNSMGSMGSVHAGGAAPQNVFMDQSVFMEKPRKYGNKPRALPGSMY